MSSPPASVEENPAELRVTAPISPTSATALVASAAAAASGSGSGMFSIESLLKRSREPQLGCPREPAPHPAAGAHPFLGPQHGDFARTLPPGAARFPFQHFAGRYSPEAAGSGRFPTLGMNEFRPEGNAASPPGDDQPHDHAGGQMSSNRRSPEGGNESGEFRWTL